MPARVEQLALRHVPPGREGARVRIQDTTVEIAEVRPIGAMQLPKGVLS
jgi:hypothetical protein